jgi:hypothetical protein
MGDQKAFSGIESPIADQGRDAARRETEVLERLWGLCACERCGETILLGEKVFHAKLDGRTEVVCSACASTPSRDHLRASLHVLPARSVVSTHGAKDAA